MSDFVDRVLDEQRARWLAGERPAAEQILRSYPALGDSSDAVTVVYGEFRLRRELGEAPAPEEYLRRFPQLAEALRRQFEVYHALGGALPPADEADEPPPEVPGFRILHKLGRGGAGVVYQAWQTRLNRAVALKILRPGGPGSRRLFAREAEVLARLSHPHVVQVYDYGEHAGRPYLAMEYVDGGTLAGELTRGLTPREAAARLEVLARAAHALHQRQIVHRDLKPANVLLTRDGALKVADFGLAKYLDATTSLLEGHLAGTLAYMAPEQITAGKDIGPAADVYALGVILYEALTGEVPFREKDAPRLMHRVLTEAPAPPRRLRPDVPPDLQAVCLRCLHKEPGARFSSAKELADRLRDYLDGRRVRDGRPGWVARAWRAAWRKPAMTAAVPLMLIFGGGLWVSGPPAAKAPAEVKPGPPKPVVLEGRELVAQAGWVVGKPGAPRLDSADRCLRVSAPGAALLEVVADPRFDRYRATIVLRHDSSELNGTIALYFGHRAHAPKGGAPQHAFYALGFSDRGRGQHIRLVGGGLYEGQVALYRRWVEVKPFAGMPSQRQVGKVKAFTFTQPINRAAPWRELAVDVTPEGVRTYWRDDRGRLVPIDTLPAADLAKHAQSLQEAVNQGGKVSVAVVPTDFRPRSPLGLYVYKSSASVRRFSVEPLPPGR